VNVDVLKKAQNIAAGVIAGVKPDQMSNATPCKEWDVSQLIDHLVGTQKWGAAVVSGRSPEDSGDGASKGDYQAAFAAASAEAEAAFSADGALERMVNPGFGDMPGSAVLGLTITDAFTHAWDLATATGQDADLDPDLAGQLLAASEQSMSDDFRSAEGTIFGLRQDAPDGAPAAAQLAAFLGRKV
jgi:uncharacterized protein (TIGR03086 family)